MNEETVFITLDLPADYGRDWEWFADTNLVALRRGMSCEQRLAALEDMQHTWKRAHLSLVESA